MLSEQRNRNADLNRAQSDARRQGRLRIPGIEVIGAVPDDVMGLGAQPVTTITGLAGRMG